MTSALRSPLRSPPLAAFATALLVFAACASSVQPVLAQSAPAPTAPAGYTASLQRAQDLQVSGDDVGALVELAEAMRAQPTRFEACRLAAASHYALGNPDEGLRLLREARERAPAEQRQVLAEDIRFLERVAAGKQARANGLLAKAARCRAEAFAIAPGCIEEAFAAAVLYLELGEVFEAAPLLAAVRSGPSPERAGWAKDVLRQHDGTLRKEANALCQKARIECEAGHLDRADALLQRAAAFQLYGDPAPAGRIGLLIRRGRIDDALTGLRKLIAASPDQREGALRAMEQFAGAQPVAAFAARTDVRELLADAFGSTTVAAIQSGVDAAVATDQLRQRARARFSLEKTLPGGAELYHNSELQCRVVLVPHEGSAPAFLVCDYVPQAAWYAIMREESKAVAKELAAAEKKLDRDLDVAFKKLNDRAHERAVREAEEKHRQAVESLRNSSSWQDKLTGQEKSNFLTRAGLRSPTGADIDRATRVLADAYHISWGGRTWILTM